MISWIQRTFAKHFRLVFLLVLAAMAIPLIVVFSPSSGVGRSGNKVLERNFFGTNLDNPAQATRVFSDGRLSGYLRAGYSALQGAQLQQYSLQRIAGLALSDELHLPVPTPDQVSKYVLTLRAFQDEQGQFDQKRYSSFADSLKAGSQITTADVNRVLRDDARLDQLTKLVGGPGYVLPNDVKQQLARADAAWTVQVATIDYAAFSPVISVSDELLKKFHADRPFNYEVPARPRLSYVEFKGEEFTPPIPPTEAEQRAFYNANAARFPVPADPADPKPATLPATTPATDNFPKVRAQVESSMKKLVGLRGATKAANDLTIALFERKLAANTPALTDFLAAQRRPAKALAPFSPDTPPADLPWLAEYGDQISRLSKDRFFSDPLTATDSVVVLLWNESLPAYKPLFAEVKERVTADYKEAEKRRLFNEHGKALQAKLQAAAKSAPTGFGTAAAAEKLEVKSYANFNLRQPPPDLPYPAFSALQGLSAGQVSDMIAAADKGHLVYAQEKKLPDLSPANPRYAEIMKQLMAFTASSNQNSYLGELVERELKKTEPAAP